MRRLVILALTAALATPALAEPNPTRLRLARSSAVEMTRFAVAQVCLPLLVKDLPLETAVKGSAFPWKPVPGAYALYGTTPNYLKVDGHGECYFRIDHGDPAKLRLAVLDALTAADAPTLKEGSFDSGPEGSDGPGKFRQEHYCVAGPATGDKTLGVVISTGTAVGPKLQMSLFVDPKACGRRP